MIDHETMNRTVNGSVFFLKQAASKCEGSQALRPIFFLETGSRQIFVGCNSLLCL